MSDNSDTNLLCNEELADDVVRSDADTYSEYCSTPITSDESSFIARLLESEPHHMPHPDYLRFCENRSSHFTARQDSINSILKVHSHFQFKPVTAFLSINYLDRFLSSHILPETGWPFQLLSLTCLSLAAKMEELYVPLLLDLQMLETTYVFEPKTIQRMELLVMATLKWRLRSVTPFDYLHYFISMLPSSASKPDSATTLHSIASNIILNTTRVIDFLGFPASVIAAAAVISAAGQGVNLPTTFDDRVDREMVRSCHQLMEEYLLDTCPSDGLKVMSIEPLAPPSPIGVLDAAACASCDTHSENPASVPGPGSGAGGGEAEPEPKRQRLSTPDVQEPQP
ncbi:cyclin-D1-1-like isoform X1 [Sesamum indicum]|uniref:Cyclin-D1-1-like isoform X1 n=1 Tax=Sesamum indicum TaxID=4182 RepID=A0A6I9TPP9_SESIN|nr:cyclin-D1-1-like isoform X1 [Sesamum indicum]